MCLIYNPTSTGNVNRSFKNKDKRICYKVLRGTWSPVFKNFKYHVPAKWQPGWIISNRQKKKKNTLDDTYIGDSLWDVERGIHVLLTKHDAETWRYRQYEPYLYKILKVVCHKDDFVAAGFGEAVFMKVEVTQEHWDKRK